MKKLILPVLAGLMVLIMVYLIMFSKQEKVILPKYGITGERNSIVFLGDSITDGYGVEREHAFPSIIGQYWKENEVSLLSVNKGISGDTTDDVLERLDSVLSDDVYMVFLEIGANDAFQNKDTDYIKSNIIRIIERIQEKDIKVVLMAMRIPANRYGVSKEYNEKITSIYDEIGKEYDIPVMSSLVEQYERNPKLWLDDGIHPSGEGHMLLARNVLKFLNPKWILK